MCGIFGLISAEPPEQIASRLRAMRGLLAHRGPDGDGERILHSTNGQTIGLGHVRLSIVAPDETGAAQPMDDPSARYCMTFNGEIYNYPELQARLSDRGHRFAGHSDSAVLLAAYTEWGSDCLPLLRGMFAFAIWDRHLQTLFLARDAAGKKPLWLRHQGNSIAFASEIQALNTPLTQRAEIDPESVADYLLYKYVPDNRSLLRGVRELPVGSWATIAAADLEKEIEPQIWYVPPRRRRPGSRALTETDVAGFRDALTGAVKVRLRSDVPIGIFLSGGVDSSAVVATASQLQESPFETFSVDFQNGEEQYSEAWAASIVAKKFGTRHNVLTLDAARFEAAIETATWHRGAPLGEISDVALMELSRMARTKVKTVLSGEGADELLAGYPRYWGELLVRRWQGMFPPSTDVLPAWIANTMPYAARRLKILIRAAAERDYATRQAGWFGALSKNDRTKLAPGLAGPGALGWESFSPVTRDAAIHEALAFDKAIWLPSNILARGDRMTMAAGLETRMPFMDTELSEFVSTLPEGAFLQGRTGKVVLRRAMAGLLPETIAKRPKYGFRVPFHEWCRGPLSRFLEDRLLDPGAAINAFMSRAAVEKLVAEHMQRRRNHEKALWAILGLEVHLLQLRGA